MCAAGLQSVSYWTPVEKLILHLSPVTKRKAVKTQQSLIQSTTTNNNNNIFNERKHRRGRRTHSEPSHDGHGLNRASLESIHNGQQSNTSVKKSSGNDNEVYPALSGHSRVSNSNGSSIQKDTNSLSKVGFQSVNFLPTSSPRHHRNLLLRRGGCANHVPKTSINSLSSNSLSSPTSGSASSENDEQSLFSNEIQTMKCHCLFKVCN